MRLLPIHLVVAITDRPPGAWGRLQDLGQGGIQTDGVVVDAKIGQRPGLHRLLLGSKDALHRGIPRLPGLVRHADDRRQVGLDGQACGIGVPPDADGVFLETEARPQRGRPAETFSDHGRDHAHAAVGRGHAADHQVRRSLARAASTPV